MRFERVRRTFRRNSIKRLGQRIGRLSSFLRMKISPGFLRLIFTILIHLSFHPKVYADQFDPDDMPGAHHEASDRDTHAYLSEVDFQKAAKVYRSPEEFDGKKEQALYYAMIAQIDDQFSRLLQALEESGQKDNTLIVFTSDHGEALGDHGLLLKGCRFYEGLVRVPLIFSWPGVVKENIQANGLVELLDLSATILDFAGLEIPEYFQGSSLRSILEGKESGEHVRDSVRCEYFDAISAHFLRR